MENEENIYSLLWSGFRHFFSDVWTVVSGIFFNLTHAPDGRVHFSVSFILLIIALVLAGAYIIYIFIQKNRFKKQNSEEIEKFDLLVEELKNLPGENNDLAEDMQISRLLENCVLLGVRIDTHTNRKNNSKKVGELVYKLCRFLKKDKITTVLYVCASLVYDAGFLSFPKNLFYVEILSADEKERLKKHVEFDENYFEFVPYNYVKYFEQAVTEHHEHADGSGYPLGLKGEEYGELGKIICAAETYVSLISSRQFHHSVSSEMAIKILKENRDQFDEYTVLALEKVVF